MTPPGYRWERHLNAAGKAWKYSSGSWTITKIESGKWQVSRDGVPTTLDGTRVVGKLEAMKYWVSQYIPKLQAEASVSMFASVYRTHDPVAAVDGKEPHEGVPVEASFVSCVLKTKSQVSVRVEMHFNEQSNCIEIRCPTGGLVVVPNTSNSMYVYVKTHWDEPDL